MNSYIDKILKQYTFLVERYGNSMIGNGYLCKTLKFFRLSNQRIAKILRMPLEDVNIFISFNMEMAMMIDLAELLNATFLDMCLTYLNMIFLAGLFVMSCHHGQL
jgi:hypothetical protein